jgi:hypothetical protein
MGNIFRSLGPNDELGGAIDEMDKLLSGTNEIVLAQTNLRTSKMEIVGNQTAEKVVKLESSAMAIIEGISRVEKAEDTSRLGITEINEKVDKLLLDRNGITRIQYH